MGLKNILNFSKVWKFQNSKFFRMNYSKLRYISNFLKYEKFKIPIIFSQKKNSYYFYFWKIRNINIIKSVISTLKVVSTLT